MLRCSELAFSTVVVLHTGLFLVHSFKLHSSGPEVIKKIMINSAEHDIFPAHKC